MGQENPEDNTSTAQCERCCSELPFHNGSRRTDLPTIKYYDKKYRVTHPNSKKQCILINPVPFRRTCQDVWPAGVPFCLTHSIWDCLTWNDRRELWDNDTVKKYRDWTDPPVAKKTVHPAKAGDVCIYANMSHGYMHPDITTVTDLISPPPKSWLDDKLMRKKECVYASSQKSLLGRVPYPSGNLPENLHPQTCFGKRTQYSVPVRMVVNPPKSCDQVEHESEVGHELYRKSHMHYWPSEQINRNFFSPPFDPKIPQGDLSHADYAGNKVKECFSFDNLSQPSVLLKNHADFIEHTRPKIGKSLSKIHPPTILHAQRKKVKEELTAADLIQNKPVPNAALPQHELRFLVNKIRTRLERLNYVPEDFRNMLRYYDKTNTCRVTLDDFYKVCLQIGAHVEKELLPSIMEVCEALETKCGVINYAKFMKYLDWEEMPIELARVSDESKMMVPCHEAKFHYETSYAEDYKKFHEQAIAQADSRPAGIPSVRTDLAPPTIKSLSSPYNYGEELDMKALINPSIFTSVGLSPAAFFEERDQNSLKLLFYKIGVEMSEEFFQEVWCEAAKRDPWSRGRVCLETFREVLEETTANKFHQKRLYAIDPAPTVPPNSDFKCDGGDNSKKHKETCCPYLPL